MSTRATVWIKSENTGEERFLYHHCDGYMLDEELSPILRGLEPEEWTVIDIAEEILKEYDTYKYTNGVGWDSEYVYKIDVDKRALEKFECGISNTIKGDRKEEKTQKKYLAGSYDFSGVGKIAWNEETATLENEMHFRNGYLKGLAVFMRNIHEKTLKKDFNLTDEEVAKVFEYMAQPQEGKESFEM